MCTIHTNVLIVYIRLWCECSVLKRASILVLELNWNVVMSGWIKLWSSVFIFHRKCTTFTIYQLHIYWNTQAWCTQTPSLCIASLSFNVVFRNKYVVNLAKILLTRQIFLHNIHIYLIMALDDNLTSQSGN